MRVLGSILLFGLSGLGIVGAATTRAEKDADGPHQAVTYAADVEPLLREHCVGCHHPGGSAPFSLLTYEDASRRAQRIAKQTSARTMPPWLPNADVGTFVGERRLTAEEITILREWADEGAPAGDMGTVPPPPSFDGGWELGRPDLVVTLPAYTLSAEGNDIYRNLVVDIPVTETRWVESVQLRPGDRRVVHHARMMVDTTGSSRELDAEDEEPGFDGMDVRSNAGNPTGHFVGWTPGKVLLPPLDDMAWRVEPGTDLVVQLHLRTSGQEEVVDAQVGFYFADSPPTKAPAILIVSSMMIDIPPGESDYRVTNTYVLPVDLEVLSVYPHAHYLGKDLRGRAVLPNGDEVDLIHIPNWDFDWQDEYRFREPIRLPAGTAIVMEYSFDNSADNPNNPSDPPRRVVYGSNSTDEMADLIIQVLPRNAQDRERLIADQAWKHEAEDMAYMAASEYAQGERLLIEGRLDEAIFHFQETLQYRGDHMGALVALSRAFAAKGDPESALLIARQGVTISGGGDPFALDALAAAYAALGDADRAVDVARDALRAARARAHRELADSLEVRIRRYRRGGPI